MTDYSNTYPIFMEVRSDNDGKKIHGTFPYANLTQQSNKREVFLRGAFANSINGDKPIHLLFEHDNANIIGTTGYNLELKDTEKGLEFECRADEPVLKKAMEYRSVSVGFLAKDSDSVQSIFQSKPTRLIRSCELFEVSLVKNPAYPNTQIEVRSRLRNKWL